MISPKRIGFVLALISTISVTVICVSNFEQTSATASSVKVVKVLRRKDKKQDKPTAAEAASAQDITEERKFEDKIPKHVPIKFKLKADKEKKFKDLKNPDWYRDFELEVTNISDKPIYFLDLDLVYPEIIDGGAPVAATLRYGRINFIDHHTTPLPSDVPIQPGETYTFKIPEPEQRGWEWHKKNEHTPDPKKLILQFGSLSFGDGTGYDTLQAVPYPYRRNRSATSPCRGGPVTLVAKGGDVNDRSIYLGSRLRNQSLETTGKYSAGSFFVNDGSYSFLKDPSLAIDVCCGSGCSFLKSNMESCW